MVVEEQVEIVIVVEDLVEVGLEVDYPQLLSFHYFHYYHSAAVIPLDLSVSRKQKLVNKLRLKLCQAQI